MTAISEYVEHLRRQGIEIQVRRLGTLWTLPELIDWESKAEVIRFLGLRRQIAHCLVYTEDRLIDWKRHDVALKKLKLHGPHIKKAHFELALGTLDGDAADADMREQERLERSHRRQAVALIGEAR